MIVLSIEEIIESVAITAQEYSIKKAELFGSYANGSNTPNSDVDLLVEFTTPSVSLLTLNSVKYRLEELLQASVDVIHGPLSNGSMIEIDRSVQVYVADVPA